MKILQVNNVYAEKSTGKITQVIHEGLLAAGHESLVVFGRGPGAAGEGVIRLCPDWYGKANSLLSRFTGMRYGGCLLSTLRLQRIIRREKPDIVHLQCINGNFVNIYRLVRWLKDHKIRTVLTLHAEFMYTANCGHAFDCDQWQHGCKKCPDKKKATKSLLFDNTGRSWRAMRKAFAGFEENCLICPVSPWTESRARQSDILKNFRFQTVYNGVNTAELFHRRGVEGAGTENMVLSVSSYFCGDPAHPKGGWNLIQLAKRIPEVTFLVAGKAAQGDGLPENLQVLGEITDQRELAELYRRAKLSVVVSRKETFSMPCAESLCCGTPVVGFRAGAPEQISLPEYSEFTDYGDLDTLEKLVRKWLGKTGLDRAEIAQRAERVYSSQTMIEAFLRIYRRLNGTEAD